MGTVYDVPVSLTVPTYSELRVNGLFCATLYNAIEFRMVANKPGCKVVSYYYTRGGNYYVGYHIGFTEEFTFYSSALDGSVTTDQGVLNGTGILSGLYSNGKGFLSREVSQNKLDAYSDENTADLALSDALIPSHVMVPIIYRLTNASASTAPTEAAVGDTVNVPLTFFPGYSIANSSDIYVTNNGVLVPSTYSNGTLTFTMPDPS